MASFPLYTVPGDEQHNIVSEMSLVDGTEYEVQNRGGNPIRYFDVSAAAPDREAGKEVLHLGFFTFTASTNANEGTWVWGVNGPAVIAVDDDE